MNLYLRPGTPTYYVSVVNPLTGVRVRATTGETEQRAARKAAQAMLAAWNREAEAGRSGHPAITVGDALARYLASIAHKPTAQQMRFLALKATGRHPDLADTCHIDPASWLHDLTPIYFDDLVRVRTLEGSSAQTIAHEVSLVRAATRYVAGLGFRGPDTLLNARASGAWSMPKVVAKTRYLSLSEYQQVYDYLDPGRPVESMLRSGATGAAYVPMGQRYEARQTSQDLLIALAMTGGRWGEVARLTWAQVDLDRGVLRVWGAKSRKERLAPLPGPAKAMLARRLAARVEGQEVVFPGTDGGFRSPSSCQPILRAMQAVGLNTPEMVARHGKATVHSLRHTFASLLLQNGAEMAEVQEALGHSTLHMTRRYTHLARHKSASRLGAILTRIASRDGEAMASPAAGPSQPAAAG